MDIKKTFKRIKQTLWKDEACNTELQYMEQFSWILFLKYLNDLEVDRKSRAEIDGKAFKPLFDKKYRWESWACPRNSDGSINLKKELIEDDLIRFVSNELFPYFQNFKESSSDTKSFQYKLGQIFTQIKFTIESGNILRDVCDIVNEINFFSDSGINQLGNLYEEEIKAMGNSGTSGGQYYTPRPLVDSIVKAINPSLNEKILDPACGSGGFLISAYDFLYKSRSLTGAEFSNLQKNTLFGIEKIGIPFAIGNMNMIMHGIETPNIIRDNALREGGLEIGEDDRFDIILANPPFGGDERNEIKMNFEYESGETAYLFMQYFIKKLKTKGRAGIVIKNTFLSNPDAINIRKELISSCNLHSILHLPVVFTTAKVETVVLFFEKGDQTKRIWNYQLYLDRNIGKTNPLNKNDLEEFDSLFISKTETQNSWITNVEDIDMETYDLSPANPNKPEEIIEKDPKIIFDQLNKVNSEINKELEKLKNFL